ncbi:LysR substrate-binding domain-containing protein [Kribbella deserti]|uniref:LysR substrate-binding domain-containing protein n=1 Tax=Kribbella deserti TaxID=1926257 RepID=A0ABV6QET0_9ACTN
MDDLITSSSKYDGVASPLRLGSVSTVTFVSWLSRLERELEGREIRPQVDPCGGSLTDLLAADVLDIAMLMVCDEAHAPPCPSGVNERKMVDPEPALIIMAADHRLAGQPRVSLTDLADETWIVPPAGRRDGAIAAQRAACEAVGFTPHFRADELGHHEVEQLIAAGGESRPAHPRSTRCRALSSYRWPTTAWTSAGSCAGAPNASRRTSWMRSPAPSVRPR